MQTQTRFIKLTAWLLTLAMLMTFILSFTLGVRAADDVPTAIYVSETASGTEDGSKENPYTTLQAAFDATKAGGNYDIILLSDITVSDAVDQYNGTWYRYENFKYSAVANVTLKSDNASNPYTIYRDCDEWMLRISGKDASNKLTFTIRDVVLNGKSENYSSSDTIYSLITVANTDLYIESGAVLRNNTFTAADNGGGAISIANEDSSLIMNEV